MAVNRRAKLHIDRVCVSYFHRGLYHAGPHMAHWDMSFFLASKTTTASFIAGRTRSALRLPQSLETSFIQSTDPSQELVRANIDVTGFSVT